MRSGDKFRRDTLSMLRAALKNTAISSRAAGSDDTSVDDEVAQGVIEREAKKRRDSITEYDKAGRADLSEVEARELAILQDYLPQQLSDGELEELVKAAIAESGAEGPKGMGPVMALLKPRTAGVADGKRVSEAVKRLLAG